MSLIEFQVFFKLVHVDLTFFQLLLNFSFPFDRGHRVRLALDSIKFILELLLLQLGFGELLFYFIDFIRIKILQRRERNFKLNIALFSSGASCIIAPLSEHVITDSYGLRKRLSCVEINSGLLHFPVLLRRFMCISFLWEVLLAKVGW